MGKFSLSDIKVFYNQHGQPNEVLMSYELFKQLESKLWELMSEEDINRLWEEAWEDQVEDDSTENNIDS